MIGLGTFTFALYLYFIQLAITILLFIYLNATFGKCKGKHIYNKLKYGLFFNNILGMAIEGMIEFLINGYLNAMTSETSSFGEVIGISLSTFCIFISAIFLPSTILYIALTKNEEQIRNLNIKNKFGVIFESMKIKNFL